MVVSIHVIRVNPSLRHVGRGGGGQMCPRSSLASLTRTGPWTEALSSTGLGTRGPETWAETPSSHLPTRQNCTELVEIAIVYFLAGAGFGSGSVGGVMG